MKTPPFLIGATLIFWGFQTNFPIEGIVMAVILESSRFIKTRWEYTGDEFARIWTFCNLLLLAALIFAFNDNGGPSEFTQLFENLNSNSEKAAGAASNMTADAVIKWLPMIFFLFVAAQTFSPSDGVPLESVFFLLRSRLKRARKRGQPTPPSRQFNVLYPYFALCLFSAAGHPAQNDYFYYGLCILLAWILWPQRSRRFAIPVWLALMAVAVTAGYFGQRAFGQLSRLAEEYDPQLLSYFMRSLTDPRKSRTDIGDVGKTQLSGKIVVRLTLVENAPPPNYLREATYRELRELPGHSYKQRFAELQWDTGITNNSNPDPVSETPPESGIFPLHSSSANHSAVTIACYLNGINTEDKYAAGVLPLPPDCNRLENSHAYFVYRNNLGTVLAEGPRLMIFDAHFGSGMVMDAPPETDESIPDQDLRVPTNEIPALDQVITGLHLKNPDVDHARMALDKFFADNFTYSLWQDPESQGLDTNATALSRFLLQSRKGHCEYFATATVLLLRRMGIPARYAVGYYVHEPSGDGYIVRERDAHAWCLVWNANKNKNCWETFDTTPSDWVSEGEKQASPLECLSDLQSWLQFQVLKFFDYSHNNIRDYVFWALIPALAFLLYRIFRGSRRHKNAQEEEEQTNWPGLDSEFYLLEQKLLDKGLLRGPDEPLSAWLQRATQNPQLAEIKPSLENILQLHYRYRFDPRGLTPSERQTLRHEVQACLSHTTQSERESPIAK
ncbi:MAG TPA: transglutaminase domain-containing protein [Verrucomicrobiae bacterium]|nr:transglutaminase domain-containing protein [Verrucomicrobiae bacterium]